MAVTLAQGRAKKGWTIDHPPTRIGGFVAWYAHERILSPSGTWLDSVKGWSEDHGIPHITVQKWLRDERVLTLLDNELRRTNAGPIKVQEVLDMLHKRAVVDEDVQAAKVYLQAVDRLIPKSRLDVVVHDARGLSNEQLYTELRRATAMLESRTGVQPEILDVESTESYPDRQLDGQEGHNGCADGEGPQAGADQELRAAI